MLAFPRLEELVFLGFWNPDEDVCDEILRAVRLRSRSTTGVSSIKRLALGCEIIPDPLLNILIERYNFLWILWSGFSGKPNLL